MPVNGHKQRDVYLGWWKDKNCKLKHDQGPFRKVVDVITYGPPS